MFTKARDNAPCIIFIDEIDSIGRKRSEGERASDSIVVELLSQMDGFEPLEKVLIIAATNKPEVLDPALLRPGRFDKQIVVPTPDLTARVKILEVHTKNRPLDKDVTLESLAKRTYGFSGADLANLANEAALSASRREGAETITTNDFDIALDRITMGIKRPLALTKENKWATAVHEAGHTICVLAKEEITRNPLYKVTIVPHGEALGLTMMTPDEESYGQKLKELKAHLVVLFGGRIAEELLLGGPEEVSTGASNDIRKATDIAWRMVTKFGFSGLGPISFGSDNDGYLGPAMGHDLDEHTASKIYEQVGLIVAAAEKEARAILTERIDDLTKLAEELLEKETIDAPEVRALLPAPAVA